MHSKLVSKEGCVYFEGTLFTLVRKEVKGQSPILGSQVSPYFGHMPRCRKLLVAVVFARLTRRKTQRPSRPLAAIGNASVVPARCGCSHPSSFGKCRWFPFEFSEPVAFLGAILGVPLPQLRFIIWRVPRRETTTSQFRIFVHSCTHTVQTNTRTPTHTHRLFAW